MVITDNITTVACLLSLGCYQSDLMMKLSHSILTLSFQNKFTLIPKHISAELCHGRQKDPIWISFLWSGSWIVCTLVAFGRCQQIRGAEQHYHCPMDTPKISSQILGGYFRFTWGLSITFICVIETCYM